MINAAPLASPLVRLSNAYLVDPEDGSLTTATASVWVDENSGRIVHIAYDEDEEIAGNSERRTLSTAWQREGNTNWRPAVRSTWIRPSSRPD
jgi:hypothetical protein